MQLKTIPAFRALLRAVEARFYHHIDMPGPILDVGCGDGHFSQMAFTTPLHVGIDPWWGPLKKAQRSGMYHALIHGLGDRMPFPDETFATAVSNSVLEHIPDVQAVLNETSRVLQPGGKLVITMPSHLFTEYMGGAALFERLGAAGLADQYRAFFNFISRHEHTDPPQTWAARLALAGFEIERWQYYFSKEALRALEIGHVQGLPAAVMHALTGHWIIAPWRSSLRRTERWLRPLYEEETARSEGAYLLFVARKQASHPIDAPLPRQRPFALAELREPFAVSGQPSAPSPQPPPTSPLPSAESETPITNYGLRITDHEPPAPRPQTADTLSYALILLSLFAAVAGQSAAGGDTPTRSLGWFIFSGAALLLLGWRQNLFSLPALPEWRLPSLRRMARRRWLLLPALLLAIMAQGVAGSGGYRPFLAIILWLAGIAAAFYALQTANSQQKTENENRRTNHEIPVTNYQFPVTNFQLAIILFLTALLLRAYNLSGHPFILNGSEASIGLDALNAARGFLTNPFATGWLTNPTLPAFLLALPVGLLGPSTLSLRLLSPLIGAATVAATFLIGQRLYGRTVGLLAATLLAGSHFHLHYSRLGLTNVWDPLLALLALGLAAIAWHSAGAREDDASPAHAHTRWLWAGLAIGLNAYVFTGSRLLPLMLLALLAWALLWQRPLLRRHAGGILAAALLALVVALPQMLHYNNAPGLFMQRGDSLSIWETGWLQNEAAMLGVTEASLLRDRLGQSLLAFGGLLDKSPAYRPPVPLLGFGAALFFALGLLVALLRARSLRYALLVVWVLITAVFGGAFLIELPSSHRLLIAAPALSLLAAVGLATYGRFVLRALPPARQERGRAWLLPVLLALALLFVAGEMAFYFGRYPADHNFGDRNTEIADRVSGYLNDLDGEWSAYFYGPPSMYADFPTFSFLAVEFQRGVNLFDVAPGEERPLATTPNLVFILLPESVDDLADIRLQYPDGVSETFAGYYSDPLFHVYTVTQ